MISSIIFQPEAQNSPGTLAVLQANALRDLPYPTKRLNLQKLEKNLSKSGSELPVGSVEYMKKAFALCGLIVTPVSSYPKELEPFLGRQIIESKFFCVPDDWFVKPKDLKKFTGAIKSEIYDQLCVREPISPTTPVWASAPVIWVSEWRYYLIDGELAGFGRYDDGPEDAPTPDLSIVNAAIAAWTTAPKGGSLDFGVLKDGRTALVEANDGFSLGYYKGTLTPQRYLSLLISRWTELVQDRTRDDEGD